MTRFTILPFAAIAVLAFALVGFALSADAGTLSLQERANLATHGTLPSDYVVIRAYGAYGFIATRNGREYFVQGTNITYLDPRYSIHEQIRQADTRRRRFRD